MPVSATGANPTPQPLRTPEWQSRYAYESEMWDQMANVVFEATFDDNAAIAGATTVTLGALSIPCPVATALQIEARSSLELNSAGFMRLHVLVDGVELLPFADHTIVGVVTVTYIGVTYVAAGTRVVTVTAEAAGAMGGGAFRNVLGVRRGRKPPT